MSEWENMIWLIFEQEAAGTKSKDELVDLLRWRTRTLANGPQPDFIDRLLAANDGRELKK